MLSRKKAANFHFLARQSRGRISPKERVGKAREWLKLQKMKRKNVRWVVIFHSFGDGRLCLSQQGCALCELFTNPSSNVSYLVFTLFFFLEENGGLRDPTNHHGYELWSFRAYFIFVDSHHYIFQRMLLFTHPTFAEIHMNYRLWV